jgi:hypothetical protein
MKSIMIAATEKRQHRAAGARHCGVTHWILLLAKWGGPLRLACQH